MPNIWRWLLGLFAPKKKVLKVGPMPEEERQQLAIYAFHRMMESGQFANVPQYPDAERDCAALMMKTFMEECDYELSPKERVKAAKECRLYVDMVFMNKWI